MSSDDLVKRLSLLADSIELGDKLRWGEDSAALREAKDRIEELEAKLRQSALQELSALDQASEAYQAQLAAEAKLAKAVEALEDVAGVGFDAPMTWAGTDADWERKRANAMQWRARDTLAELKGQGDD